MSYFFTSDVRSVAGFANNANMRAGAAGLGPPLLRIVARVLPSAQFLETAHTLACAAGLGPSLVR